MVDKIKEFKYFTIHETTLRFAVNGNRTNYFLKDKKNESIIGYINYSSDWKKFVFTGRDNAIYDVTCLKDIISFMESLK